MVTFFLGFGDGVPSGEWELCRTKGAEEDKGGVRRKTGVDKQLIEEKRLITAMFLMRGRSGNLSCAAALEAMMSRVVCSANWYFYEYSLECGVSRSYLDLVGALGCLEWQSLRGWL